MIRLSGTHHKRVEQLKREGKTFQLHSTTKSKILVLNGVKYIYADSHFKKSDLGLFNQLKKEVEKNITSKKIKVPEITPSKYFEAKGFKKIGLGEFLSFDNVVEFDINKAYYKVAFVLGYISEDFYKRCIELDKNIRLALIGSLATKKIIYNYENGKLKDYTVKENKKFRKVFFHLVEYVDEVLFCLSKIAEKHFLFYWVDGIYLENYKGVEEDIKRIEKKFKVEFSKDVLKRILIINESENKTTIAVDTGKFKKNKEKHIKLFNLNCIFVKD